ncbi:MFS transporter [Bradyrhizobium sp. SZCCHNRI1003]|uniref:MFS transporter n=1 Tax=Bradyrhizobium sp. SZCCHNRI1003 TaxID=3057275 RepID=UPI002915D0AE|nr:MFS transporter [Bradyrhizobium sp. SZCCHNRI1003]
MLPNRWTALALFFFTRLSLGFQFQSIGSVAPFLIDDFTLRYVDIGTLVGLYLLPGALVAIPSGLLGRRFGDKHIVLCGMALMMLGGVLDALSSSYWSLVLGRLLSGTGASFLVVLMSKMVVDWFAGNELVFAMSIYIVGWPAGIALGQATQAVIAVGNGWRASFHTTALFVAMAFVLLGLLYRDPRVADADASPGQRFGGDRLKALCLAGAIWMLVNASYLILLTFGPALVTEQGVSVTRAAFTVSLMSWTSMLALPIGAFLATRYQIVNTIMFLGLVASAGIAAYIPFAHSHELAYSLFGLTYSLALPVVASLPAQLISRHDRNLGFGIYWAWFYAGIPLLTGLAGYLRDHTDKAASPALFSAAILALSLVLLLCLRARQRRMLKTPKQS